MFEEFKEIADKYINSERGQVDTVVSCPLATEEQKKSNWIFNCGFINELIKDAEKLECDISMEQVDTILTILLHRNQIKGITCQA